MRRRGSGADGEGCALQGGCVVAVLIFNALAGGMTFDYCLRVWFGRDVPFLVDMAAGMVLGQFTAPLAALSWVATLCGAQPPFVR